MCDNANINICRTLPFLGFTFLKNPIFRCPEIDNVGQYGKNIIVCVRPSTNIGESSIVSVPNTR